MTLVRRTVAAIRYRLGQFIRALAPAVPRGELAQALSVLPSKAQGLLAHQARHDQRHALAVYGALAAAGHTRAELLQAALLHDVGKGGGGVPLWARGATVVLKRLAPRLATALAEGPAVGWRRPFAIQARHAEEGARRAEEVGCPPLTISLIRRHQERMAGVQTEEDHLLALLQAADGRS